MQHQAGVLHELAPLGYFVADVRVEFARRAVTGIEPSALRRCAVSGDFIPSAMAAASFSTSGRGTFGDVMMP